MSDCNSLEGVRGKDSHFLPTPNHLPVLASYDFLKTILHFVSILPALVLKFYLFLTILYNWFYTILTSYRRIKLCSEMMIFLICLPCYLSDWINIGKRDLPISATLQCLSCECQIRGMQILVKGKGATTKREEIK